MMGFYDVLAQVIEILEREGRTSYRALKRHFELDDEYLDDLKLELIEVKQIAVDDDSKILVWTGDRPERKPDIPSETDTETRFHALLPEVTAFLQRNQRVTYCRLISIFGLTDNLLDELRNELTFQQVGRDEKGKGLVWTGEPTSESDEVGTPLNHASISDTPMVSQQNGLLEFDDVLPTGVSPDESVAVSVSLRSPPEAERRQLTVMFCDLVESTALSGQLEPEDLREVVRAYQESAAEVIERYEGHIAQYLGDGLLVYFGYPMAHEDAAQRAVRTGLDILATLTCLNQRLDREYEVQLRVRLGIHTGPVVVGEMGGGNRQERLALGETPNVAARLEALAEPNMLIISAATAQLVTAAFALDSIGFQHLKGVERPIEVFRVDGALEPNGESVDQGSVREVFLVGRDEEMGLLTRRWEQSRDDLGQVVLLSGAAGIGKSALVERLRSHVSEQGCQRLAFQCSPYHTHSALYPVIEHLQRVLRFEPEDSPSTKLDKLKSMLQFFSLQLDNVIPIFATLLSIDLSDTIYPTPPMSLPQYRQETHDALVAWLLEEAEQRPVLAVWEDLHWADPSTLDILGQLVEQVPTASMLNVFTYRPEFNAPWPYRSHVTPISLSRLERSQLEAFMLHITGGKPLPREVNEHIITKTDGIPLFAEELTKMLLASDILQEEPDRYRLTGSLDDLAIPATLQDSLMARLDQLGSAKDIAQLGAVLGREFPYEMIQALRPGDDAILQTNLSQLVEAELLYQRGRPPRSRYVFKHALIQDAAYASLLNRQRQQLHRNVVQILRAQFHEWVETQPELVAHHYTASGAVAEAIGYWQLAGERDFKRSANAEAIRHFTVALDGLAELPEAEERIQHEFEIYVKLAPAYFAARGSGSLESAQAYQRLRELCTQVGQTTQLAPTLLGLFRFYTARGEHRTAFELGEQLCSLTCDAPASYEHAQALYALGTNALWCGKLLLAFKHFTACRAVYGAQPATTPNVNSGHDPHVACLVAGAIMLWPLGYPDQARQWATAAIQLADQLSHPYTTAFTMVGQGFLQQLFREELATHQERIESTLALTTEYGFRIYTVYAMAERGWCLAMQGQYDMGIEQLQHNLSAMKAMGVQLATSFLYAYLTSAYVQAGEIESGLQTVDEALRIVDDTEERFYEAEFYRLKGELSLQQVSPNTALAESYYQQAIEIAQRQSAKSWELRAVTSLARLWQEQGRTHEAHNLLTPVYSWYTEGFDTADLQDAQSLLNELSESR